MIIILFQELVSSPIGSKNSQTDSQSEFCQGNNQEESGQSDPTSTSQIMCLKY